MKNKIKGFTLVELIIVIAIIGILTAILVPSWMNYIAKSRLKTQNQNARVIFNAAQTIAQEYKFQERKKDSNSKYLGKTSDFYFYWDGNTGMLIDSTGNSVSTSATDDKAFAEKVNKIFTGQEDNVYKIYIKDYMVQSVASGRYNEDRYIGSYPVKQDQATQGKTIKSFVMTDIDL